MIVDGGCKAIRKAPGKGRPSLAMETVTRQKVEFGGVGGSERVHRELVRFQLVLPGFNESEDGGDVQVFVNGGIFLEIGLGEFEQGSRGPQTVFLEVNERARKLDETLIERVFGAMPVRKPELFEDFVGFKVKAAVEAFKKAEIIGVQILPTARLDEGVNFGVFFGHMNRVMQRAKGWQ